ncbi:MAG: hypothetical protein OFPI_25750 [Osedax symbiont Rs2]|nr:MAG: hypothetical protein OFPI_25750 [Osedax symbiont Rs2]
MTPQQLTQAQLDAYNRHDINAFMDNYAEDVLVRLFPSNQVLFSNSADMATYYAKNRFNLPNLHAQLVERLVQGNIVIDKELVTGLGSEPVSVIAMYEVVGTKIKNVWFIQ